MKPQPKRKPLPDARLRQLAMAIAERRAWTTQHVPKDLWLTVFMPLLFARREQVKGMRMAVGVLGEDRTVTLAVNGYPIFFSCTLLNARETRAVVTYAEQFTKARQALLQPASDT